MKPSIGLMILLSAASFTLGALGSGYVVRSYAIEVMHDTAQELTQSHVDQCRAFIGDILTDVSRQCPELRRRGIEAGPRRLPSGPQEM